MASFESMNDVHNWNFNQSFMEWGMLGGEKPMHIKHPDEVTIEFQFKPSITMYLFIYIERSKTFFF